MVLEEVERIGLGTDRLIRTLSLPDHERLQLTDLDQLLATCWTGGACSPIATGGSTAPPASSSARRSERAVCLDTLLENSVRYTRDGDVVRLVSSVEEDVLSIGVADSGDGFTPATMLASLRDESPVRTDRFAADPKSQTGLGLGLVHEAVRVRRRLVVGGSPGEGGRPGADGGAAGPVSGDVGRRPGPRALDLAMSRKLRSRRVSDRVPPRG